MRRDAREAVFVLLYRDLFDDEKNDEFKNRIYSEHKLNEEEIVFADKLYACVNENKEYILNEISALSKGFLLNRIFCADKCALLIGIAELKFFSDVPKIVAIDEAVALSKKYSSEKSQSFVNGILAEFKKQSEADV